jgi:hypothetical protein
MHIRTAQNKKGIPVTQAEHKHARRFTGLSQSGWVRIIIIAQLALLAWQFTPDLSTNGDDACFYLLGKAIHDGKGYHKLQHPDLPAEKSTPIVFPLMLAFIQIFSPSILAAKIVQSLIGALITLLAYYLFRLYSKNLLLPLVALCAACATLAQFSSSLMSEAPFVLFSLLALYLYELSVARPNNRWLFWLSIVISVFPLHCRSIGLAFSASWLLTNLLAKRYRYMIAHAVVLVVTVAAFHLATKAGGGYFIHIVLRNSYDPEAGFVTAGEMAQRVLQNIQAYGSIILQRSLISLPPATPDGARFIITAACLIFILAGWVRGLFGPMKFLSLYVFMYFGIILMWQTQWSSERFVAGVIPFLYFFLLFGIEGFVALVYDQKGNKPRDRFAAIAPPCAHPSWLNRSTVWIAAILIVLSNVNFQIAYAKREQALGPDWKNFYSCADWIRTNTPPGAVVMNRKVELFFVRSKHQGVMYPYSHDINKIMKTIDDANVAYVIFDNFAWTGTTREYLYPVLTNFQNRFQMVYALDNPPTAIYKVLR